MKKVTVSRRSILKAVGVGAVASSAFVRSTPIWAQPVDEYTADVAYGWVDVLFAAQRDSKALPPTAARVYGLAMLAGYEAVVDGMHARTSLSHALNDLGPSPVVLKDDLIWPIAANKAIGDVAVAAMFDKEEAIRDSLVVHARQTHRLLAEGQDQELVSRSVDHGDAVASWLISWAETDGFRETRDLPYQPAEGSALWRRTPPNFGKAIEPHWDRVRPFALPPASENGGIDLLAPEPPIAFDTDPDSAFYKQALAVLDASRNLTEDQKLTAMYWRDNPDGVTGLPAGHWLQIARSVSRDKDQRLGEALHDFALTALGVSDAFTSCWIEKYRSNLLRPVTYINEYIDSDWASFVNSPAFPEYTSGHSVGSGAAAVILTELFGERTFTDHDAASRVVEGYQLVPRTFNSFHEAANEAAVSRLYGGIHYPMAIDNGLDHGRAVAQAFLDAAVTS